MRHDGDTYSFTMAVYLVGRIVALESNNTHLQGGLDSKLALGEIVVFLGLLDSLLGELLGS